jgi:fructose-1,6-bisphosphatase-3
VINNAGFGLFGEFVTADHLHRHIDFLYSHGSMYKVANGNLLFHGCVPLNEAPVLN